MFFFFALALLLRLFGFGRFPGQREAFIEPFADGPQHHQSCVLLVIRRDEIPGRIAGAGAGDHIVHRLRVRIPLLTVAIVLVGELVLLVGGVGARFEAA